MFHQNFWFLDPHTLSGNNPEKQFVSPSHCYFFLSTKALFEGYIDPSAIKLSVFSIAFHKGKPPLADSDDFFQTGVDLPPPTLFGKLSGNFFLSKIAINTPKIHQKSHEKRRQIIFWIENEMG